jgi:hypothetical protein
MACQGVYYVPKVEQSNKPRKLGEMLETARTVMLNEETRRRRFECGEALCHRCSHLGYCLLAEDALPSNNIGDGQVALFSPLLGLRKGLRKGLRRKRKGRLH